MLPGIGIFGTGNVAHCLVPVLKINQFEVKAIWGRTKELAEEAASNLDIPFCTRKVDELLLHKDVDLVIICCPPHLQTPIALKALGIGKHVICCAPTGPTSLDIFKMLSAAEYYPTLMGMMCYCLRHAPNFLKMKEFIQSGYVGDVNIFEVRVQCDGLPKKSYDWSCDNHMGGGMLNVYGSAIIDLMFYLTHQKAVRVNGFQHTFTKQTDQIHGIREITSDDFCTFQMECEDGAYVSVTLNGHVPNHFVHEVVCCGTEGHLTARGVELYGRKSYMTKEERINLEDSTAENVIYLDFSIPNIINPIINPDLVNSCDAATIKDINVKKPKEVPESHYQGLVELIRSLKMAFELVEDRHAFVKDPVNSTTTFEDALYVQSVVDAVMKSSDDRMWTKVNVITQEPDMNPYISNAARRSTFS